MLFSTIQKPYCRHFSFLAEFVDALKHAPSTGANFKRWQMRVTLWLTIINVFWVSEGKPEGKFSPGKEKAYSEANTIFCGAMVGVLVEILQDMYLRYETAKEMWDILNTEYGGSDADIELYIIEQYHDYQMVDGKSVVLDEFVAGALLTNCLLHGGILSLLSNTRGCTCLFRT
jgi:hypothetical protein